MDAQPLDENRHKVVAPDEERSTHLEEAGSAPDSMLVLPIIEEEIHITKEIEETGRVRITKTVEERQETVSVPLSVETIEVNRVPIDKYVEEAPPVRHEGNVIIYPVLKEVLVVEKKLLLVEEIHLTRNVDTSTTDEIVTLRREHVSVERETVPPPPERPD